MSGNLFKDIRILYYNSVITVTKSLCGFVSNQVQYSMESAQYLW